MDAQVAYLAPVEKRHGRRREDDLAAVRERAYTRAAVHVDADVALPGDGRRTRVQSHADRDRPALELMLSRACGVSGAGSGRKGDEEGVALCVDLDAAVRRERFPQHSSVLPERFRVGIWPERVEQARRALDVREEEGHGACGEIPAHGRVITPAATRGR